MKRMSRFAAILVTTALLGFSAIPTVAQSMGQFVAGDVGHGGSGSVSIVVAGNGFELQIKGLKTDAGPDLKIILVEASNATTTNAIKQSKWISLGDLKATSGDQTYALPAGADPEKYHTVAVWCETYSVLFTAAPLSM